MASLWLSLFMGGLSLLTADGLQLPSLRLLVRDGLKAAASPDLLRWHEAGRTAHESPPLVRMKRGDKVPNHSSMDVTTCCAGRATVMEATTEVKKAVPVTEAPMESTTEPLTDTSASLGLLEGATTDEALTKKAVPVTEASMESTTEPLTDTSASLGLLEGATTEAATATETIRFTAIKHETPVHNLDKEAGLGTASTKTTVSQDGHPPHTDIGPTAPQNTSKKVPVWSVKVADHLTETEKVLRLANTTSSPTLAASVASTATPRHGSGGSGPGEKRKLAPAPSTPASPASTACVQPAGSPAGISPGSSSTTLVRKCLLGIFLLALVASIFIITTAVLAAMLWRQKRAYRSSQCNNHTEMVCISSLLAAEEAEEEADRKPRVKRMRMLAGDGSETEIDNLTLNSFLPEH